MSPILYLLCLSKIVIIFAIQFPFDIADITLADFWGIENVDKSMDQDLGTSLIMVNSQKGKEYYESLGDAIVSKEFMLKERQIFSD